MGCITSETFHKPYIYLIEIDSYCAPLLHSAPIVILEPRVYASRVNAHNYRCSYVVRVGDRGLESSESYNYVSAARFFF